MKYFKCIRDLSECVDCGFCKTYIYCPSPFYCIGCLSCYKGCPNEAIKVIEDKSIREKIKVKVENNLFEVPSKITVKKALEILGFEFSKFPDEGNLYAPCEVGACYSCMLKINGEYRRACVTLVEEGMSINLSKDEDYTPLRPIHGPQGHTVGGVGTPWWVKGRGVVEVAIWAAGCNLSCPQCQNFHVTYDSKRLPVTPREAAEKLTAARLTYGVDRMAISGGEPTINKEWLTSFFKELKKLNRDEKARFHLDTNATILSREYVDELVLEAGVTDIGPDLKGFYLETFMEITGIRNRDLAEKYLKNSWDAVKYIVDNYYPEKVFMGVGVPYNPAFMTLDEVHKIGLKLASIDPELQICLLDYFPTFRRKDISRPTYQDMVKAKKVLEDAGCKVVIAQTEFGHIGPERDK